MTNNDDKYKQFQESLEHIQGQFHVLETNASVETQMGYFRYSEQVRKNENKMTIEEAAEILNSPLSSKEEKKLGMIILAISRDVKAYRVLESYAQHPEDNLREWASLSFLQAKITLESEFSEEKHIFISTGLGGKGDMLRFYAFFKSNKLIPFSPYQIQLIEEEIPFSIKEYHGTIEELKVFENYFSVVFLINIKSDIKKILEDALVECNQYGDFIDLSFIITNVKIFSKEDIEKELKENTSEKA